MSKITPEQLSKVGAVFAVLQERGFISDGHDCWAGLSEQERTWIAEAVVGEEKRQNLPCFGRCKDCKHYHVNGKNGNDTFCTEIMAFGDGIPPYATDTTLVEPDFGCIHFEAKEQGAAQ